MSIEVGAASAAGRYEPAGNSGPESVSVGGMELACPSFTGGTVLEAVAQLAKGWREAIEAADAGIRSCQVA